MIAKVSVRCVFDRLYQENWLEQVTTKNGQSNWSIASLCSELVAKMAKDIGMTIRKGIVVPFLPCLVAFWGFHPYMFFHFFKCFFVTCTYNSAAMSYTLIGICIHKNFCIALLLSKTSHWQDQGLISSYVSRFFDLSTQGDTAKAC